MKPRPDAYVGSCEACGGAIYYHELDECDCGRQIHYGCKIQCETCQADGCALCMIREDDNRIYFCDTKSNGVLEDSECWQKWKLKENE